MDSQKLTIQDAVTLKYLEFQNTAIGIGHGIEDKLAKLANENQTMAGFITIGGILLGAGLIIAGSKDLINMSDPLVEKGINSKLINTGFFTMVGDIILTTLVSNGLGRMEGKKGRVRKK
jgi:hypothetical protein